MMFVKRGRNSVIAHDLFADFLTDSRVMQAFATNTLSPTALRLTAIRQPTVRRYRELCDGAAPMPNFPHMRSVWRLIAAAQAAAIAGADPEVVAERAARGISAAWQAAVDAAVPGG